MIPYHLSLLKGHSNISALKTILLNNFKASINHAGNISAPFPILRGCRQGDPIASALFIICIEILCIKLSKSENVKGFKIGNLETLLSLYADMTAAFS